MDLTNLNIRKDKINQFNKKGIYTVENLIDFLPKKYYDFTKDITVNELKDAENQLIIGKVIQKKKENGTIKLVLTDKLNQKFYVHFYHKEYMEKMIQEEQVYAVGGKVKVYNRFVKIIGNPVIFTKEIDKCYCVYPVYSSIQGMSDDFLKKQLQIALTLTEKLEFLEINLLKKYNLVLRHEAYRLIHHPKKMEDIAKAQKRLIFDKLFLFHYKLKEHDNKQDNTSNIKIKNLTKTTEIINLLPFELTDGQKKVLKHFWLKMKNGEKIHSVVQADTGAGKSIVSFLLASTLADNGYLAVMAAPTVLLANQHYKEAKELFDKVGLKTAILTSETKKRELNQIKKDLSSNNIDFLIGTHSVLNNELPLNNLGIILCDEEHKFGVDKRNALDRIGVHKVSFSATPIPRSIFYAMNAPSIELNEIKSMPSGRKEMILKVESNDYFVYQELEEELSKGHQGYIVCPFVNKSEATAFEGVDNVEDEFQKAKKYFKNYTVGMVHGKMKDSDVTEVLEKFRRNEIQLLVASQVIEVGLSVPNANFVAIKSANRFGFSSLLQILGRAKRSSLQPKGWLLSNDEEKMKMFSECKNGFDVAKLDLRLRGCGHYLGTEQSGENPFLMFVLDNETLNQEIIQEIEDIFKDEKRKKKYYIIDSIEL